MESASTQWHRTTKLGDFTTPPRVILLCAIAAVLGVIASYVALALLRLIGLFSNLLFYGRLDTELVSLADNSLGPWVLVVPVGGGIVIGLMARFGSERIRGHGIPEAIEAILMNGSRVEPKVAVLKPLSSAISIGSGGPFGAEGPIIMTGGAVGSVFAQLLSLTSAERKSLLVAGAAAGMSATFGTPIAAVLLAVELLLFEMKPRSLLPVATASAVAGITRHYLLGPGPLLPVPPHPEFIGLMGFAACAGIGISAGALSALLTNAVYAAEDAFARLPIHWMWWPAIGGLAIGIGGLVFPESLGVGYEGIESLLAGEASSRLILGLLIVKSLIWAISLGSGTSGGVLAPLLLIGGAMGAAVAPVLPEEGGGFWPLIAMGAILGGTMRSPLTGIAFAIELTHDVNALLPLLIAVTCAHGFTVLALRRSILTEKISRRGYHLGREYSLDPLELVLARDAMRTNIVALPNEMRVRDLAASIDPDHGSGGQRLYPVVDADGRLVATLTRTHMQALATLAAEAPEDATLASLAGRTTVVASPGEPLRIVADRMAETGLTRIPVVDDGGHVLGIIALTDLLKARARTLEEEVQRERVLRLRALRPGRNAAVD